MGKQFGAEVRSPPKGKPAQVNSSNDFPSDPRSASSVSSSSNQHSSSGDTGKDGGNSQSSIPKQLAIKLPSMESILRTAVKMAQNRNNARSISVVAQGEAAFDHGHQVKAVVAHKPGDINAKVKNIEDLEFLVSYSDDHEAEYTCLDQIRENPEANGALIKYLAQLAQIIPK